MLTLFNCDFHSELGFREQSLGFVAGEVGLTDLGDDLLGGFLGDFGDGELEDVALGDGGVKAGACMKIHQLADDGETQVGQENFGRDELWFKYHETGGADVFVLLRSNDGTEAADGADGGGDDVALMNLLAGTAGGFIGERGFAAGGPVTAQAADFDVAEAIGLVLAGIKSLVSGRGDIVDGQAVCAEFGEQLGDSGREVFGIEAGSFEGFRGSTSVG